MLRVLAALPLLFLVGAAPVKPDMSEAVVKLECHSPMGGYVYGSGTFISSNMVLTAAHVTSGRYCLVNGRLAPTLYQNNELDVAVVVAREPSPAYVPISCSKPVKGRTYQAIGYPGGNGPAVRYFIATETKWPEVPFDGLDVFMGQATPGMSGSALTDRTGKILGILNAGNDAVMLSRLTSQMWMCR